MYKLHIYKGGLVALKLEIQYSDEMLMHLDISIGMLALLVPGQAIVPWVWAADDQPLQGKRLKEHGWHVPLLIERWRMHEALEQLDQAVIFTPLENIQVLERMEDGDFILRTYVSVEDGEWEIADEAEVILEDTECMLGI